MYRTILAPTDGSKHAQKALDHATELAKLTGAELHVLTVFRHSSGLERSFSMIRAHTPGLPDDAMREYAKEIADKARNRARDAGVDAVRAFVRSGHTARAIVEFSQKHEADLIVIGSRGVGSADGYLLGSVSHKVTGLADRPVLVV